MNSSCEDIVRKANRQLKDLENSVLGGYSIPAGPVFFIVGAPRAGTTLLLQTIINHFAVAYINNLVAKFWEAPVTGAAFFQSIQGAGKPVAYESSGGFTEGIFGPHEFGYFWQRFFHYGESNVIPKEDHEKIDTETLIREIAGLEKIFGKPVIFKNPAALSLQVDYLASHIPNSYFIYIRREPFFIAQSLYLKRLEKFGDAGVWYSVKPAGYNRLKQKSPEEQVAGQVMETINKIETDIRDLTSDRLLILEYETFCREPGRELGNWDRLMKFLVPDLKDNLKSLKFKNNNRILVDPEVADGITRALSACT